MPPRASRGGLWSSHRAQRQTTTTMPKSSRPQSTWPHLPRERVETGSTWTRRRVSTRDVKTFFYETTTQSGRKKTNVVDGPTHHAMMVLFGRESSRGRTRAKAYRRKLKPMRIIIETTYSYDKNRRKKTSQKAPKKKRMRISAPRIRGVPS